MGKNTTKKTSILSDAEWAKVQRLAENNLRKLAKQGLIGDDEFDFDDFDKYEAKEEVNKFISYRLPYVD